MFYIYYSLNYMLIRVSVFLSHIFLTRIEKILKIATPQAATRQLTKDVHGRPKNGMRNRRSRHL